MALQSTRVSIASQSPNSEASALVVHVSSTRGVWPVSEIDAIARGRFGVLRGDGVGVGQFTFIDGAVDQPELVGHLQRFHFSGQRFAQEDADAVCG